MNRNISKETLSGEFKPIALETNQFENRYTKKKNLNFFFAC